MTSGPAAPFDMLYLRPFFGGARAALARLGPGELTAETARRISGWILKPAEAIVRRWIWLIAARLTRSGAPVAAAWPSRPLKQAAPRTAKPRKSSDARPAPAPRFRLTEPLARPSAMPRAHRAGRTGLRAAPDPANWNAPSSGASRRSKPPWPIRKPRPAASFGSPRAGKGSPSTPPAFPAQSRN